MIHVHVGRARNIRNVAAGGLNTIGVFVFLRQQQITSGYAVRSIRSPKMRRGAQQLRTSAFRLSEMAFNTIIAKLVGNDLILCPITSQFIRGRYTVSIDDIDFETESLKRRSNVRSKRIFQICRNISGCTECWSE